MAASGNAGPFTEASPLAYVGRALEALTNFRCDARRAAWRPTGVDGPTWETLTWLWEGRADSAANLYAWSQKQLYPRAFSEHDYAACLDALAARGWAAPASTGAYAITELGRHLRPATEDQTNAYFFGPWQALTPDEIDELAARAKAVVQALSSYLNPSSL